MRRTLIGVAGAAITLVAGIVPAGAQEQLPVNVIVTEGVGRVCEAAAPLSLAERDAYGTQKPGTSTDHKESWCRYPGTAGYNFAVNPGQTTHSQWWVPGHEDGSKFQGLFLPGIGPGATGPYLLEIIPGTTQPPGNLCVDSIEGPGCGTRLVGKLTPGPTAGHGAHAGGSQGTGKFSFQSASGAYTNSGTLGWDQSAATILPLTGTVDSGDGAGADITGFSSSRGVTGDGTQGNAGVTLATIGFQVEGMLVIY